MNKKPIEYVDDNHKPIKRIIELRLPSLAFGLVLGICLSFITSRFEELLSKNIQVAYFIPFIVYMADAVGTQTQNIYSRDLKTGHNYFKKYLIKESIVGIVFGILFSVLTAIFTIFWFSSYKLTLAVSLSMFCAIATAPLVAMFITELLELEHTDPAAGAGPIATIIQDALTVLIYGFVASAILL